MDRYETARVALAASLGKSADTPWLQLMSFLGPAGSVPTLRPSAIQNVGEILLVRKCYQEALSKNLARYNLPPSTYWAMALWFYWSSRAAHWAVGTIVTHGVSEWRNKLQTKWGLPENCTDEALAEEYIKQMMTSRFGGKGFPEDPNGVKSSWDGDETSAYFVSELVYSELTTEERNQKDLIDALYSRAVSRQVLIQLSQHYGVSCSWRKVWTAMMKSMLLSAETLPNLKR